jgi:N-sulfoglucosamine sulfohydrolase
MLSGAPFPCAGGERPEDYLRELAPPESPLDPQAPLAVHGLFTDGMVLQRDRPVPVWGWGAPGATVTVEFAGQSKTTVVDSSNHWKILLDPMPASSTPQVLSVFSPVSGIKFQVSFSDVLVGDVWLCTGQSNMQVSMKLDVKRDPPRATDIENADNPLIRFFKVDRASSRFPRRDIPPVQDDVYEPWSNSFLGNQWRPCTPEWVPHVAAAAFYFAREIQPQVGCPVGILVSARGGTAIDKWVSRDVMNGRDCWAAQRQQLWESADDWDALIAPPAELRRAFAEKYPDLKSLWLDQQNDSSLRAPAQPTWPTCFYNGMIHPLAPVALKGVLWYQGEGDAGNPVPYEDKLTDLITSWRTLWSRDDLPFIVAQLAGFDRFGGTGAELRDAQARVAERVPDVYLANLIDTGMHQNIHPVRKDLAGDRMARVALKEICGQPVDAYGPALQSVREDDGGLLLTFTDTGDGLEAREVDLDGSRLPAGVLRGFMLAGKGLDFVEAAAEIRSANQVFVSSENVRNPVAVRYAWADFPLANLYNTAGLPAAPFQSELSETPAATSRPNIVLFTVDDMDITSVNCYGNPLPNLTPNMDRLASQGMRFLHAHVNSPICMPCRQSMMTGLQPHRNRSFGFVEVEKGSCPSLPGLLHDAGYCTASIGKGRDYQAFPWDKQINGLGGEGWYSRKPDGFYDASKQMIQTANAQGRPLFLGVNTSDPHRPFAGSDDEKEMVADVRKQYPTAPDFPVMQPVCSEADVPLLPYLPDLPQIRKETVQYLTCVKRADDTLGRILDLIEEEGLTDNTIFIFVSDHDAAMPTAKQNCYAHSSATPLMVRWPGQIRAGSVDSDHMVSTLDLMPTILESLNLPIPGKQDGRSMLSILRGGKQAGRDAVFTSYNYIVPGQQVFPMRAVHTKEWSYVFNPWSDGVRKRDNTENQSGLTFAAMRQSALTDPKMKERVNTILLRRRDELFDLKEDPYSFKNLADSPEFSKQLNKMKQLVVAEMDRSEDPLFQCLENGGSYPTEWDDRN